MRTFLLLSLIAPAFVQAADWGGSSSDSSVWSSSDASCTTELDVATYYAMKSQFDLILDVRSYHEYVGDTTNAKCSKDKCTLGHDRNMYMLVNPDRDDKAVIWKDADGVHNVNNKVIQAVGGCYQGKAATMKIAISCHSGSRSMKVQQALVNAGFACGNLYNVKPGAQGIWQAWNASGQPADDTAPIFDNTQMGPWSCPPASTPASMVVTTTLEAEESAAPLAKISSLSTFVFLALSLLAAK